MYIIGLTPTPRERTSTITPGSETIAISDRS
jgi:hypothetical protein